MVSQSYTPHSGSSSFHVISTYKSVMSSDTFSLLASGAYPINGFPNVSPLCENSFVSLLKPGSVAARGVQPPKKEKAAVRAATVITSLTMIFSIILNQSYIIYTLYCTDLFHKTRVLFLAEYFNCHLSHPLSHGL